MSGGELSSYGNLLYIPDEIEQELKKYYPNGIPERIRLMMHHANTLTYEMYKLLKAIDYMLAYDSSEQDFIVAYNQFRAATGCVCREDYQDVIQIP